MAKTIRLDIVTPEKVSYSEDVNMVIARTTGGDIGVLPGHAPLIAGLAIWPLRVQKEEGEVQLAVCGGFIEVTPEKVTVLGNCVELAEDIDIIRAEKAKERAEARLRSPEEIDVARAEAALKRAMARLKAAENNKSNKM